MLVCYSHAAGAKDLTDSVLDTTDPDKHDYEFYVSAARPLTDGHTC